MPTNLSKTNAPAKKSIKEKLSGKSQRRIFGLTLDDYIRFFFRGNATVAIVVLFLIMFFLFKEGWEFIPQYQQHLILYRKSGMEFVDDLRTQIQDHNTMVAALTDLRITQFKKLTEEEGLSTNEAQEQLAPLQNFINDFRAAILPHKNLLKKWTLITVGDDDEERGIKGQYVYNQNMAAAAELARTMGDPEKAARYEALIQPVDFKKETQVLIDSIPEYAQLNVELAKSLRQILLDRHRLPFPALEKHLKSFPQEVESFIASFKATEQDLKEYDPMKPWPAYTSILLFFTGTRWVTQSYWHDWFGILPLLSGSLLISILALVVAVPLSVCAAIYVNQVAGRWQQNIIKPCIEFISAVPSVVLGFFGIAVLGTLIRDVSQVEWLNWVPGFPMKERLNITTAGLLLALMSIPTIFTLVEDALNNVPKHFVEASYALGATRIQTVFRILIPASLSGTIAAVLLGFGRVIGETMVVLLVAGNCIQIPDISQGLGVFFQPAHTMTGIIAQELGEVVNGSLHYRALFMVGMLLFLISLLLNYFAQNIVRKYKISIG